MSSLRGLEATAEWGGGQGIPLGDKCTHTRLTFLCAIVCRKTGREAVGCGVLVAAAVCRARVAACVERATAGAARDRVGVVHREAATHQAVDEIDLGALDVPSADRVDEQPNATDLADGVALFRPVLETHAI